jgi:hypothetical protein
MCAEEVLRSFGVWDRDEYSVPPSVDDRVATERYGAGIAPGVVAAWLVAIEHACGRARAAAGGGADGRVDAD